VYARRRPPVSLWITPVYSSLSALCQIAFRSASLGDLDGTDLTRSVALRESNRVGTDFNGVSTEVLVGFADDNSGSHLVMHCEQENFLGFDFVELLYVRTVSSAARRGRGASLSIWNANATTAKSLFTSKMNRTPPCGTSGALWIPLVAA